MPFDDWRRFPAPSRPRDVHGGIKANTQRGKFGETWWAQRWIAVLESFHIGSRLQRGRSYARRGQVVSIDVRKGSVEARVQGSRPQPYQVTITMRPLSSREWKYVAEHLSGQAVFAAKLLAGEMPRDIESGFRAAGLSLFPEKLADIKTNCSCPDWSNPCKHVAAVYYLLGEAFDQDPFLIFRLRGMEREEFIGLLGEQNPEPMQEEPAAEPLPEHPADFWSAKPLPDDFFAAAEVTAIAALPRRLGNLQFWRGAQPLPEALEPSYARASEAGLRILEGDLAGSEHEAQPKPQ